MKQAELIYALALLGPATVDEIAELFDSSSRNVSPVATNSWRRLPHLIGREKIEGSHGGKYRYYLKSPD